MKKKNLYCILFVAICISVFNILSISDIKSIRELTLAKAEASIGFDELPEGQLGGWEESRHLCEEGSGDMSTECSFNMNINWDDCNSGDESSCNLNPDGDGDVSEENDMCKRYGHFYYETICFRYCHRCDYSKKICND